MQKLEAPRTQNQIFFDEHETVRKRIAMGRKRSNI